MNYIFHFPLKSFTWDVYFYYILEEQQRLNISNKQYSTLFFHLAMKVSIRLLKCLQQFMSYSIPKGRNYQKENLYEKKYYGVRHSEKTAFFSLMASGNILQERVINKSLIRRQSQDLLVRRALSNQSLKPLSSMMAMESKYGNLNKKIKDILGNNNSQTNKNRSMLFTRNGTDQSMTKSSIIPKRSVDLTNQKQIGSQINQKRPQISSSTTSGSHELYFLQCLKRKNSITTEFYINIHTSILTFKQFYKLAQQCKPKTPDITIPSPKNRKTIVFDMDETLIHTSEVMTPGYEIKVPFKAFQGKISSGFVNVRPYAKELLKKLGKYFDIILFTAGNKCYADPILDHIDPTGVIQHRLYRQSCTFVANQLFIKDLRIIGRPLQHIVLVDNAPHSYMLQLSNGIPILNYFKGKDDNQLFHLQKYLMNLLDVEDVRVVNQEYFKLHEYMKHQSHDRLINALYTKKVNG